MQQLFRHRFLLLLIALLLLFALYPFLEQEVAEAQHVSAFFTVILIAGLYAVSRNRTILALAVVLAVGMLSVQWLVHAQHVDPTNIAISRGFGFLFFLLTTVVILSDVLKSETVTADKIYGAICAYLMLGLMWAFLFCMIEVLHPGAFLEEGHLVAAGKPGLPQFAMINSLTYYSMSTLTTLGYGDILPKAAPARALSNLEAITGQMYLTILIARLVGMHISHSEKRRTSTKE